MIEMVITYTHNGMMIPKFEKVIYLTPIPVAMRSKAWVCGRLLAGIVGSNPSGGIDVCLL
jgi:hypothetical protein